MLVLLVWSVFVLVALLYGDKAVKCWFGWFGLCLFLSLCCMEIRR